MKRILSLLMLFCSLAAMGQYPVSSISITMPPNPAANTGDWAMPFVITAQAKLVQGQVPGNLMESRILVTVKEAMLKKCGSYTQQTAPMSNFNTATKSWSGAAAVGFLGNGCTLKPGTYELCVQFFSGYAPVIPLSNEVCKSFTIADTKQQSYSPPQNIMPANGKVFTEQEAGMPIMLRWTPVVPKPQGDVLYKVRLIEILPGQNKTEALRTNTPIDILEVKNNTQTSYKLSKRITGLYWEVEAESAERVQGEKPRSYGKSEATSFSVKKGDIDPDTANPPKNVTPADGKVFSKEEASQPILFKWIPVLPKPKEDVLYKVRVIEIKKGQPRAEALKTNTPTDIFEIKNSTQTTAKLSKRCNGCEYIWDVTATGTEKVQGENPKNYGTSEATKFYIVYKETPIKVITQTRDTLKNKDCITYKAPIITSPATGSHVQMNKENLNIRFVPSKTLLANYKVMVWRNNNQKRELIHEEIYPNNFNGTITGLKLSNKKTEELTVQMQAIAGNSINVRGDRAAFQKSSCAVFENNGFSDPVTFSVSSSCAADYQFSIDSAVCVEGKKVRVYCHVVFNNINSIPSPNPTLSNATFIDNATNLPITTSNFSTSISPLSLLPAGTPIPFSFDAEGETCDKTIRITYDINWDCPSGPQHIVACVDSFKLPCCYCNYCDMPENMNIQDVSHSATPVATDNLNVAQQFNISPKNISKITAEIVYMEEDQMEPACKQCRKNENAVYHFIGTNTATWNSGTAINASSGNNASTFPTKILEWGTNAQGNLAFSLTIGLPGTAPLKCCERHGKVCIRYSFTDIECKTCTLLVCYTY